MTQLSLFSADLTPPQLSDLGGLLAAHGQVAAGGEGVRLSILLTEPWRADALLRECRVRDVPSEIAENDAADGTRPGVLLRTERTPALRSWPSEWARGAVKAVPAGLVLSPGHAAVLDDRRRPAG